MPHNDGTGPAGKGRRRSPGKKGKGTCRSGINQERSSRSLDDIRNPSPFFQQIGSLGSKPLIRLASFLIGGTVSALSLIWKAKQMLPEQDHKIAVEIEITPENPTIDITHEDDGSTA